MSLSPVFEKYDSACRGETLRAQSIVECRLSDWSENKVLALSPTVTLRGAETLNGCDQFMPRPFMDFNASNSAGTADPETNSRVSYYDDIEFIAE